MFAYDKVYHRDISKLKKHAYILKDSCDNFPSRPVKFISKLKIHSYVTAFNYKHHLDYMQQMYGKDYSIVKIELCELIGACQDNKKGIIIINDMYCDLEKISTIFDAMTIDPDLQLTHHEIFYDYTIKKKC